MTDRIIGAGGGGGSTQVVQAAPAAPTIEGDNLNSKQYARIVDLISEGEIEGFEAQKDFTVGTQQWRNAALKSIFFNNTPVMRPAASVPTTTNIPRTDLNFSYQALDYRLGTQDQAYLYEIGTSTQAENQVNVELTQDAPVVRSITNVNVDGVRITVSVPQLYVQGFNGNVQGSWVYVTIQVSYNGGAWTTVVNDQIGGRTADLYQRRYRIDFTQAPPVDIRLYIGDKRPSGDVAVNANAVYWASYTELIYDKPRYPNSALVGMTLDAEQFSSIPTRSFHIRGIKVQIPSNATVDNENGRLIYSGVWDGTFQSAKWCSDPAWILWDILTSKRYGFGDQVSADQLSKWDFLAASQYASELVPDGFGGYEPRFSCNVYIQTAEEAFKLINDLCSVMRAQPYWSAGSLALGQDRPTDATFIFNQGNVTQEGFTYSGSGRKTRHTVAVVRYYDNDIRDVAYEVVEDAAGVNKYGIEKVELTAFACTSRGQARRVGEWLLYSEQNQSEVLSFSTGPAEGMMVRPGDVIRVADPVRAGRFRAGRITGATDTVMTLDRSAEDMFADGVPATLDFNVVLPTGVSQSIGAITGTNLNGNTLTLPYALDEVPPVGSYWAIGTTDLRPELWRVLSVQENGETFAVTALLHQQSKYDYIERDVPLQVRDVTSFDTEPGAPTNITAEELLYESNGQVYNKIIVSWRPDANSAETEFRYRVERGNWQTVKTRSPDYEILNADPGTYEFELQGISPGFKRSAVSSFTFVSVGKTAPPATIPDLYIAPVDQHNAELHWPQSVDLDVRLGGQIRIRHTPLIGASATWGKSNDIVPASAGSTTRKIVPLLEGTYFIRAVDSSGNQSAGVASVVVDLPEPQDALLIQSYREDLDTPPFQGTFTNMFYTADEGGIALAATGLIDDVEDWDDLNNIDFYGDTVGSGEYQFANTLDLSGVYDVDLRSVLQTRAFEPQNAWDFRPDLIDLWDDIDGEDLGSVNSNMQVRVTQDDPSATPTWGLWQPFTNGTTRGRGFQFKVAATSSNASENLVVEQLGVITQFQRRTEIQTGLTSGAATYSVTFPKAFYAVPSVGITAQDMDSGDYFVVSNVTRTGFDVSFKDSGATLVSRTFDYQAVGHGREIV